MRASFFYITGLLLAIISCNKSQNILIEKISNPTGRDLTGMVFQIVDPLILKNINNLGDTISIRSEGKELPFQLIAENGNIQKLLVLTDLKSGEEKNLEITKSDKVAEFKPMTQAEISVKEGGEWVWVTKSNGNEQWEYQGGTWKNVQEFTVPEQHTDHSFDIRYEGPGWESDKIGYRFYLDWRNAVDIFGKKVDTLVLQNVGLDGFDSYHEINDWGVDVLKVGNSLGIGTVAHWAENKANRVEKTDALFSKVDYSGLLESKILTKYSGWETSEGKTDLATILSIRAGSFLSKYDFELLNPLENLCTGIIKLDSTVILKSGDTDDKWCYFATFGVQSLQNDHLGLAVFYKKSDLIEITEDKLSHVIVLKPSENKLTYYFGATWEQDSSKIKTVEEFTDFLKAQIELLNNGLI